MQRSCRSGCRRAPTNSLERRSSPRTCRAPAQPLGLHWRAISVRSGALAAALAAPHLCALGRARLWSDLDHRAGSRVRARAAAGTDRMASCHLRQGGRLCRARLAPHAACPLLVQRTSAAPAGPHRAQRRRAARRGHLAERGQGARGAAYPEPGLRRRAGRTGAGGSHRHRSALARAEGGAASPAPRHSPSTMGCPGVSSIEVCSPTSRMRCSSHSAARRVSPLCSLRALMLGTRRNSNSSSRNRSRFDSM